MNQTPRRPASARPRTTRFAAHFAAHFAVLLAAGAALALPPAASAAEPTQAPSGIREVFGGLWAKLRATVKRPSASAEIPTYTAGIRGNEATESGLKPYWKDDREQDPAFRAERQALESAQGLADAQKYAEAATAFESFAASHPKSTLLPNARFGGALARASLGERDKAVAALQGFVRDYPQHVLAGDAQQALAALQK